MWCGTSGLHKNTNFKVNPERVSVSTVDIDLAEHVEGDIVFSSGELLDLGLSAGILASKLVAGESEDA